MGLLSSITAPVLPYALGGAVLIGALPAGYLGWKLGNARYERLLHEDTKQALKATQQARHIEATAAVITDNARQMHDALQAANSITTTTLIQKVPYYVHDQAGSCASQRSSGQPGSSSPSGMEVAGVEGAGGYPRVPLRGGLPLGFVRLHDYAARGVNPPVSEPSGFNPDAPSGVSLPALSGTIIGNYGVCHAAIGEVKVWHRWYDEQAQLWDSQKGVPAK